MKARYLFGWLYGRDARGPQLYVWHDGPGRWGVTKDPARAARFESIDACKAFWRSKLAWPESYVKRETDGYLKYFREHAGHLEQVLPL